MQQRVKTPKEVKEEFVRAGISVGAWAKQNGFTRQDVYAVLNGYNKAKYGKAHAIAVALGLKEGHVASVETFRPVPKAA
jgi:gp16 family phage-associated protein